MSAVTERRSGSKFRFARLRLGGGGAQGPLIGLILLVIIFSFASPYFLQVRNWLNILDQITVLGILAIGMTMVIIIAGIDLSVGSVLAFSSMVMGWLWRDYEVPFVLALLLGILTGAGCGAISGLLITRARLPPFIATLCMMSVARGLANIMTDGQQVVGMPDSFTALSTVRNLGFLSTTVGLFIALAVLSWAFLRFRPAGRNLYAIGGSREVARLAGIAVDRVTIAVYVVAGVLSGIAGMALSARLDSTQPSAGLGYELDAIAAVVIGGASLSGGIGGMVGTIIGVFIIGVLHNGLNLLGISPFVQQVIIGCVIAVAVTFDTLGRRSR